MAGIDPSKYQDYVRGKISYEQAQSGYKGSTTQNANPVNIFDSYNNSQKSTPAPAMPQSYTPPASSYSGSSGGSSPWQSYNPPAMSQSYSPPPAPSTAKVNMPQAQLPSWMGNSYSQVPGTDYYSTNPSNPNSSKYYADGRPVPSIGFDYTQTGGQKFDGYGTPDQFKTIMDMAQSNNQTGINNYLTGQLASGGLTSNDSIYKPGGGYVNTPVSASQVSSATNQGIPSAMPRSVNAPPPPAYTKNANVDAMSTDQQLAYYKANPAEAQQEIARAQGVGGAAAINWANQIRGALPQSSSTSNVPTSGGSSSGGYTSDPFAPLTPGYMQGGAAGGVGVAQTPGYPVKTGQLTPNSATQLAGGGFVPGSTTDYAALAAAKTAAALAQKRTISGQQKTSLDTSYSRSRQNIQEDRTLENVQNQRNLSPFSGRSDYAQGMIAQQRGRQDTQMAQDLQSQKANIDQLLADYENASATEQARIADELQRADRDYQFKLNEFNYGVSQDAINNNRNAANDAAANTGYYNPSGMNADQINQEIARNSAAYGNASTETKQQLHARNVYLNGLLGKTDSSGNGDYTGGNPNGYVGYKTVAGQQADIQAKTVAIQQEGSRLNNEIAKLELANYPQEQKLKILQLQKQIANIGAAPYQSATDAEYDRVKLETAKQQLELLKNPPSQTETADDYAKKYLDGLAKYDNDGALLNGNALESQILSSGKAESEMRKMYARYGLKWGD